jgi:hypothetical protein
MGVDARALEDEAGRGDRVRMEIRDTGCEIRDAG